MDRWTVFADPQEGAFSVDVPEGWKVVGGTVRRNAQQYRNYVNATSPDKATILALNDPEEWAYVVPTPLLAAAGFGEGSIYGGGGGTTYTVARFLPGNQFAASWARRKLDRLCTQAKLVSARERPELTAQLNVYSAPYGIRHDAGEATFSCVKDGQPMTAYALASMAYVGGQAGAIWYTESICALLAPAPVAGIAAGLLAHMVQSVQVSPAWAARQMQTNMDVSRAASQAGAAMSKSIMEGWEERGAVMDRVMEEGSRARLGIDIYRSPDTGTTYTVGNGHNYYWVDPSGTVVGTDIDTAPNGFSRLTRVPP